MARVACLLVLFACLGPAPATAQAVSPSFPAGVAVFSPSRAYSLAPDGKLAQARLSAAESERAQQVEARRRSLEAQRTELARSSAVLSEGVRAQRTQAIQRFEVDLERFIQDAQAELMGIRRDLEGAFLTKLRPALEGVVKDRDLKLVLNEDAGFVAWADPALDITPLVVERLEAAAAK